MPRSPSLTVVFEAESLGGLLGLGVVVTGLVLWMNPAFFYRRMISFALLGGLFAKAIGSVEVFGSSAKATGWLRYDGALSWAFFIAWAVVVGFLVWGDLKSRS